MSAVFEPRTALEQAIYRGDPEAVTALLDPLDDRQRAGCKPEVTHCARLISKARYSNSEDRYAGWGQPVDEEQRRAITVAAVACGCAGEIADVYMDVDQLVQLGRKYGGDHLEGLPVAMLEREWRIRDAQTLIESGLVARPDTGSYYIGLMNLAAPSRFDPRDIHERLSADPGLREALLRMLETEGNSNTSLANVDKYSVKSGKSWARIFLELAERGVYSRALLIDKVLGVLERGWIQYRSSWYSRFHEMLAPTLEEMRPHATRYLHLLASRIPPTVSFALGCVERLDDARAFAPAHLVTALQAPLISAVKVQVLAALKILDGAVERDPELAADAARSILPALAHESADVQEQVLVRLSAWNAPGDVRAELAGYTDVAAVNQPMLSSLRGAPAPPRQDVAAPRARTTSDPLRESERVLPVTTDELVERVAYLFENDTDIDEFERVLAGLARSAPFGCDLRERFAPLARRIGKVRRPVSRQLARLLQFLLAGQSLEWAGVVDRSGHENLAEAHLVDRVTELIALCERAPGLAPLSSPSHRHGYLDAVELASRLAVWQQRGVTPGDLDFVTGFMRLAPASLRQSRSALADLRDEPQVRALRYAIGEEVPLDPRFSGAARRMRAIAAGEPTAPRPWHIETRQYSNGNTHTFFRIEQGTPAADPDPVTALEIRAASHVPRYPADVRNVGGSDEGCIRYFASLLPSDPEGFFCEGTLAIGENLDWWEARWWNKAYLDGLLRSDVTLRGSALVLLALGLAGKEAGQTAVAVDALVAADAEGRVAAGELGDEIARLLAADHASAARYAKALRAALRIDANVSASVFSIICKAVLARPGSPPRDTAALLELLLELALARGWSLPAATAEGLRTLAIGGKGAGVKRKLLALPAA